MTDNLEESVIGFEALYDSMEKCRKGVLWKDSVAHYHLNGLEETLKLERQLKSNTYKAAKPMSFKVTYPKERDIVSIAFRDRVYQRSLNDIVLYPAMTKSFIYDNCACQKGKGTDFARERLKCHLQRYFRKHGATGYVLQCDIKGYYPNMRHDVICDVFREKLDPWSYSRVEKVLTEQYEGEVGFNPGSQMVQIAGISALDKIDHYIKERLHIKHYMRYMDDFILIHEDASYLEYCKKQIQKKLSEIGFSLHERKTRIYPLSDGITMLGFTFRLSQTGKVTMLIKSKNVRSERRKLFRLVQLVKRDIIPKAKADECYYSWRNHASKGSSRRLLANMDSYYKSLWKGNENGNLKEFNTDTIRTAAV